MLTLFRSAMNGPFKWVFAALLVAAFAVVGVPALENFGARSAIQVGEQKITALDVQREFRTQLARVQEQNPDLTRDQALAAGLGDQVAYTLTVQALIAAEAERLGMVAPIDVVRSYVERIPALQNPETGKFDANRLGLLLQQQQLTQSAFAELVTDGLIREQIVGALTAKSTAPQELTRLLLLRQFEERDVRYVSLDLSAGEEAPTDEEIASYYAANIANYQSPEYRTFTFVMLDEEAVADQVSVTEEEVRQLFDSRAGAAQALETRTIKQFRVSAEQLPVVEEALAGEGGFDAAAEALSAAITTLTDQRQGDFIAEEFGEAVFAAEEGSVVGPVETPFGFLIGQVVTINATEGLVFEDEREALEAELRQEIAEDRLVDLVDELEIARDEGATLAEAAQLIGVDSKTTAPTDAELFTETGSIANIPAVLAAEGRGLTEGEESSAVRMGEGYGFVAVDAIVAPAPLPLEEVRPQVVSAIEAERLTEAATRLEERFDALRAEGKSFQDAATELGGEPVLASVSLTQPERPIPDDAFARAFELQVDQRAVLSDTVASKAKIVEVGAVRFGDASQAQSVIPIIAEQFGEQIGTELESAYLAALQETTEVKQNPTELARGLGQTDQ